MTPSVAFSSQTGSNSWTAFYRRPANSILLADDILDDEEEEEDDDYDEDEDEDEAAGNYKL